MWKLFKPKKDKNLPDFWLEYLDATSTNRNKKMPIHQCSFVVFDTETTGLEIKKDKMLSIGAVKVRNYAFDVGGVFQTYVQQDRVSVGEDVLIHGILPRSHPSAKAERVAVKAFLDYCKGSILIGHHVGFDVAMVNQVLYPWLGTKLVNKQVDTVKLALRLDRQSVYQPKSPMPLDELCQKYRIPTHDRHTALGDAHITAILFMKLLNQLELRGIKTIGDLLR